MSLLRNSRPFVVVLACLVGISGRAVGQDAEIERKSLFRDGSAAADGGQWEVAAQKFRKVVAIRSAPKALIALAIAEDHLGHLTIAKHTYERAVIDAHASNLADDEAAASQALAALAPRVPVVVIHVPHPADVSDVTLDGKTIPERDAEYSVDPGSHTILGHGASDFRKVVEVKEGEHAEVSVDVASRTTNTGTRTGDETPSRSGSVSVQAVTLGIVGLVGVGIGGGLWGIGQGQQNDVQSKCGGTTNCPMSLKSEADSSRTNIILGDVVVGISAALVVASVSWIVVSLLSSHGKRETASVFPIGIGAKW